MKISRRNFAILAIVSAAIPAIGVFNAKRICSSIKVDLRNILARDTIRHAKKIFLNSPPIIQESTNELESIILQKIADHNASLFCYKESIQTALVKLLKHEVEHEKFIVLHGFILPETSVAIAQFIATE